MSSGRQKKLDQQQNYWNTQAQQAYTQAQQPSELQRVYEQKQLDFLNWDKQKNRNVADAPGLSNYIQIGQAALNRANRERMGTGALRLSDGGASGYAEKLKSLRQAEMGNEFGAGLENALAGLRAEANNSVLPLAQLNQSRLLGLTQIASGNNNAYLNRPRTQPFWQQLLLGAISGGSQVAAAAAGAPGAG